MHILTVSDITYYLRELIEADDVLRDVWIAGEVSNFVRHASGHCYFSLKQGDAVLRAVMWRSAAQRMPSLPRNGDAVMAHGRVSIYEVRGDLQLYADMLQPAGIGLLHARFEELKQRLAAEGLFDEARKRPLPRFPYHIGLVTAPQGAALRDMLTVIGRRFPLTDISLAPCLVQGEQAPDSIAEALQLLATSNVDLIIVARGGGAAEDLQAFNSEIVARAIFASPVPVITGVGHETDTTIADYVADLRAATPSAAAEIAVPDQVELTTALIALRQRLDGALGTMIATQRDQINAHSNQLHQYAPLRSIQQARQQVDDLLQRSQRHIQTALALRQAHLHGLLARLTALGPRATLDRGYALVRRTADGRLVSQATSVARGDEIQIILRTGELTAIIKERS